jgi:hypothetical protein
LPTRIAGGFLFRWLRLLNRLKSSRNPQKVDFSVS